MTLVVRSVAAGDFAVPAGPFLADAINLPLVLEIGIAILVPLMAFDVFVEALVLRRLWGPPWQELCRLTFRANVWSLLAGIPVKMLNAWIYSRIVPTDIPGYFATYPWAAVLGAAVYFLVTLGVESLIAVRWVRREGYEVARGALWKGIFLANCATYAVVAPLHFYFTQPRHELTELTRDVRWTQNSGMQVLCSDVPSGHLVVVQLGSGVSATLVPEVVRDYLVSGDLALVLFRGDDNHLYLYRSGRGERTLIWRARERFLMNQVAFSPSGQYVAIASQEDGAIEVVNTRTSQRCRHPVPLNIDRFLTLAWTTNETDFFMKEFGANAPTLLSITTDMELEQRQFEPASPPALLPCYGRIGSGGWFGGSDWGTALKQDERDDLRARAVPGLGSRLMLYRKGQEGRVLSLSVSSGLLHLARFQFNDVAFLPQGHELLFDAQGHVYLLDWERQRIGTVVPGDRFITLTPRYQKKL